MLNAKDRSGSGSVHISDFDKVIGDFGFTREDQTVKNVIEHCNVDSNEYVDFSALKDELSKERSIHNAKVVSSKPNRFRGVIAPAVPQTAGVLREEKRLSKERQAATVQEVGAEVRKVYKMLSHHEIDKDAALILLSEQRIFPTKEFIKIAAEMEAGEVPFADFNRALTTSDPHPEADVILQAETTAVFAGAIKPKVIDRFSEANPGRKLFKAPPSQHFVDPANAPEVEERKFSRRFTAAAKAKKSSMGTVFNENGRSQLGNLQHLEDLELDANGRRHNITDPELNPELARAQMHHGDCISWQQEELSELEQRNAAEAKPMGKKVSCC